MPIYEGFCFGVQGCEVYLLSSFLLLNTFGSGKKDNVFSVRGSWGTSVALNRCTSCCFGLSVWRIPAKRNSKTGNLLRLSISPSSPPIICICESWLQQNYNKANKTKNKISKLDRLPCSFHRWAAHSDILTLCLRRQGSVPPSLMLLLDPHSTPGLKNGTTVHIKASNPWCQMLPGWQKSCITAGWDKCGCRDMNEHSSAEQILLPPSWLFTSTLPYIYLFKKEVPDEDCTLLYVSLGVNLFCILAFKNYSLSH